MPRILWPAPPDDLDLAGNQVHVFCAALDLPARQIAHLAETLSPDESERARRFRFERDAARFIASRGHLREILGRFLQSSPDRLALPPNPPLLPAFFDAWTRGEAFLKA
ncbi:MAG: hypothetical protein KGR98_03085, partial [Verrucomicrobia bacterium]|nr:hypothetical protein [Verrucomicrobiota bacterium]